LSLGRVSSHHSGAIGKVVMDDESPNFTLNVSYARILLKLPVIMLISNSFSSGKLDQRSQI
jgi:hypothetical protein